MTSGSLASSSEISITGAETDFDDLETWEPLEPAVEGSSWTAFRFLRLGTEAGTDTLFIATGSDNLAESGTSVGSTRRLASARRILVWSSRLL